MEAKKCGTLCCKKFVVAVWYQLGELGGTPGDVDEEPCPAVANGIWEKNLPRRQAIG